VRETRASLHTASTHGAELPTAVSTGVPRAGRRNSQLASARTVNWVSRRPQRPRLSVVGGVSIVLLWSRDVATLLTVGDSKAVARTILIPLVILALIGYVLVGLLARPKRFVPPPLRGEPAPLTRFINRITAPRRR
jgi:hypothetical protein